MNSLEHQGFDSAVKHRKDDYLNRWPLAQEIYGIVTTGPIDWSVRVGIYGEWGTGKTSVLEFISDMAKKDGQIVINFNPWEHSTKDALWRSFVLTVFKEPTLAKTSGAKVIQTKGFFSKLLPKAGIAKSGAAILNEKAGQAVGAGLDLVKTFFRFGQNDLKLLRQELGDKRIIVLIDDLDRTAPELVPEILYALKELMNVPGFAFVCAFDPIIVGEVLGHYHPGFGDGLKFLEKIIDYPRWLPEASVAGLAKLATVDAKKYCDYVPDQALQDAIAFLPRNPRAIRQFIRLIALLQPQIQRHNEDELHWPVILAANAIKIRQPRLAQVLLKDEDFWGNVETAPIMAKENEADAEVEKLISAHLDSCAAKQNITLEPDERSQILAAMKGLSRRIVSMWFGSGVEALIYQTNLAESPHAVTWKEFDQFFSKWESNQTSAIVTAWMGEHSAKIARSNSDIYREILRAALVRYDDSLRQISTARTQDEIPPRIKTSEALFSLLECLVLELGRIDQSTKQISGEDIDKLFEAFTRILKSSGQPQSDFCRKNETLLMQLIEKWQSDITALVEVICPYGHFASDYFHGSAPYELHQRLSAAVLPKFVAQIIEAFRQPDYFLERIWPNNKISLQIRCLLRLPDGLLWKAKQKELFAVFQEAVNNQNIQENAYQLLDWFRRHFGDNSMSLDTGDAENVKKILLDKELLNPVWNAAIAKPLSPLATLQLNHFVTTIKKIGGNVDLPSWWETTIKTFAQPSVNAIQNETGV